MRQGLGGLWFCAGCSRMVEAFRDRPMEPCDCGSRYFVTPDKLRWRYTACDRRFLKDLRIKAD